MYVTENPVVREGLTFPGIQWAFTSFLAGIWHPLTWLSYMLDVQLFGLNPKWLHLVNLLIHAANSVLLFLILTRMTGKTWPSFIAAALFAWHPLHVESVAWVAERKDLLSGFFWFLTIGAYAHYAKKPSSSRYALTLLSFILGLMSKPMAVTLPLVLLFFDFWPLERFTRASSDRPPPAALSGRPEPSARAQNQTERFRLLLEKIPFFIISFLFSILSMIAQRQWGAMRSLDHFSTSVRFMNAIVAYTSYLMKTVWPTRLSVFYPHLGDTLSMGMVAASGLLILSVSILVILLKRRAYLLVGWFWYLVTLLPVIGLVQIGSQAMADRYTYIPSVGLSIAAVWGVEGLTAGKKWARRLFLGCAAIILAFYFALTHIQLRYWQNSFTLFEHALRVTQGNYLAHNAMGNLLFSNGKVDEAIRHYQEALALKPSSSLLHFNLANAYSKKGKIAEAEAEFKKTVELNPSYADAYTNLGNLYLRDKRFDKAIVEYEKSLAVSPKDGQVHYNLAVACYYNKEFHLASEHANAALKLGYRVPRDFLQTLEAALKPQTTEKPSGN